MRRALVGVVAATATLGAAPAATLAAPTVTLTPSCDASTSPYAVTVVLSGLPPGALFEGTIASDALTIGPAFLRADASGEYRTAFGGARPLGVVTASGFVDLDEDFAQDPGEPGFEASIANPCAEPPVPGGSVSGSGPPR